MNTGFGGATTPGRPEDTLVELGREIIGLLPTLPVYARIDLTMTAAGPVLMEVEVNEPSLCLHHSPTAAALFADAILHEDYTDAREA